jgi:hypothetical protein
MAKLYPGAGGLAKTCIKLGMGIEDIPLFCDERFTSRTDPRHIGAVVPRHPKS